MLDFVMECQQGSWRIQENPHCALRAAHWTYILNLAEVIMTSLKIGLFLEALSEI